MERFDKACKYTQAKLVGTLVCLVGAMAMSFLHSPSSSSYPEAAAAGGGSRSYDWILGCSYLVGAAVILSLVTVLQVMNQYVQPAAAAIPNQPLANYYYLIGMDDLSVDQAATVASFPAPLTMCSITSAMGAAFTAALQVILEGRLDMGSPRIDAELIAGIVILVRSQRRVHPSIHPQIDRCSAEQTRTIR